MGAASVEAACTNGYRKRVYTRQTELVGTCKEKDHSESEPF